MKSKIWALTAALLSQSVFAGALTMTAGPKALNGVNISTGAVAQVENGAANLKTVGAGLRAKKIAVVNVPVYITQLLMSDSDKFVATDGGALNSLDQVRTVALQLSFLRNVEMSKIIDAYQEGFEANNVNMNQPAIRDFMNMATQAGDALNGRTYVIIGEKLGNNSEKIIYEDCQGNVRSVTAAAGLVRDVFSIWLGNSNDKGIVKLKAALLSGI